MPQPKTYAAAAQISLPASVAQLTPRRQRRAAEILQAARDCFLEKGFAGTSVAEIASRVGVVEGLVYSYFPTKRELLNEVLRVMYVPLIEELESGFSRLQGLRSRLRFLVWRQMREYVESPRFTRLVLHEVRTSPDYHDSVLHGLLVRYSSFVGRAIRDAVAVGELPASTDVDMVRSLVYGGIEHHMWSAMFRRATIDLDSLADRFTDMILQGLSAASPGSDGDAVERRLRRLEKLAATGLAPRKAKSVPKAATKPAPKGAAGKR